MKNKSKILIANALASVLTFSLLATSCITPGGYEEDGFTVKFDYNDGQSRPYSVIAGEGESIEEPTTPVREGHDFVEWRTTNGEDSQAVTFPYTPSGNVTLYALWTAKACTVTFDMNYDNDEDIVKTVLYDNKVTPPTAEEIPSRNGLEFYEWQDKPEGGSSVNFDEYVVKDDVTFYAIWASGGVYTISFDGNYDGAQEYEAKKVMSGTSLKSKDAPTPKRTGYDFVGWSFNQNATEKSECITFPYTPEADGTLYAIWKEKTYVVGFRYNYVGKPAVLFDQIKDLRLGDTVAAPVTEPTRVGHTFNGWWTAAQGGTKVEFPVTISDNATYYAQWVSDAVVTNVFHAEFTFIDPLEKFPGYSGAADGAGIITPDGEGISGIIHDSNDYPTNSVVPDSVGHFVTYLYKQGATLTFRIFSTEDVSGVTLKANLATEFVTGVTVGPTGENAWKISVNGTELNYSPLTLDGEVNVDSNATPFKTYTIATNVSLKAGENVITFVTSNTNAIIGGTTGAFAPMVDCIMLNTTGSAKFSYHPIYDNLWYKSLG